MNNATYLADMIRGERARVRRRSIRSAASPVPRADQGIVEDDVGLGSVGEIVEQKPWPAPYAFIGGVAVVPDLGTQTILYDWPTEDGTGELTTFGRGKPAGPGALGISLGFWSNM